MAPKLTWHNNGQKSYNYGVDHGVLFVKSAGVYGAGVAWNGLTAIKENPSGGEPDYKYADNVKYMTLIGTEEYGLSIEAFTYPTEFEMCDGAVEIAEGALIGQQARSQFGLFWRTKIGDDTTPESGFKYHFVYGCNASPSGREHTTVNESVEPATFTWDVSTTPEEVTGFKPTSHVVVNSLLVDPVKLADLLEIVYGVAGTPGTDSRLPLPDEIRSTLAP